MSICLMMFSSASYHDPTLEMLVTRVGDPQNKPKMVEPLIPVLCDQPTKCLLMFASTQPTALTH
jgi:hypothetical protein